MPGNQLIQVLQRASQVLYAVADDEEGRTVPQIAAQLRLERHTAYKLVRTLETEQFLVRRHHPLRFALGPAIAELKRLHEDRHLLAVSARILGRTHVLFPEGSMGVFEQLDTEVYLRLHVSPTRPGVVVRHRSFIQHPPYEKASVVLFLAYSHPEEADAFYKAHPFEAEGAPVWKSRARFDDFLDQARRLGRAELSFAGGGLFRLAVPIFSAGNEVLAAVGGYISSDAPKKDQKLLTALCVRAAREITREMAGWSKDKLVVP